MEYIVYSTRKIMVNTYLEIQTQLNIRSSKLTFSKQDTYVRTEAFTNTALAELIFNGVVRSIYISGP